MRQAAREFGVAINTVRGIARRANIEQVRDEREEHWLRFALKGLAVHSVEYTTEEMHSKAMELLEKFMAGNPQRTVFELLPEAKSGATFTVEDIIRATEEMMLREVLNYNSDTFEDIGNGCYRVKSNE